MLFLGAAYVEPTCKERGEGVMEKIVVDLHLVVAKDESAAKVKVGRLVESSEIGPGEEDRLVVRVVPFGS